MTGYRVLLGSTVLAVRIVLGPVGVALADDDARCSVATLHGLYAFSATGFTMQPSGPVQPKAIVELIRFHGDGTLGVPAATRSVNGVIAQVPPGGTGTYSVDNLVPPDGGCTGQLGFTHGPNFDLFIAPKGESLWMIQTDGGNVFQGMVTRVAR